jgi:hypothetical protein
VFANVDHRVCTKFRLKPAIHRQSSGAKGQDRIVVDRDGISPKRVAAVPRSRSCRLQGSRNNLTVRISAAINEQRPGASPQRGDCSDKIIRNSANQRRVGPGNPDRCRTAARLSATPVLATGPISAWINAFPAVVSDVRPRPDQADRFRDLPGVPGLARLAHRSQQLDHRNRVSRPTALPMREVWSVSRKHMAMRRC